MPAAFWYALPLWVGYGALAPVAVYSFVNLVVVLIVCALSVHGLPGLARTAKDVRDEIGPELMIALSAWAALTCFWALDRADAFATIAKLFALFLAGIALWSGITSLTHRHLRRLQTIIIASGLLLAALYVFELVFGAPIAAAIKEIHVGDLDPQLPQQTWQELYEQRAHQKIARGVVALGALTFPVGYLIWRRSKDARLAIAWVALCFVIALFAHMSSVPVALGAALLAMAWVWAYPRYGLIHLSVAAVLFAMLLPLIALQIDSAERLGIDSKILDTSSQHRIQIYHYTSGLIADRPLSGWGFRAARNLSDKAPSFVAAGYAQPFNEKQTILPLHPHNMVLQLWLETGFIGVVLFAVILLIVTARICRSRLAKSQRLLIGGTAVFLFAIANLSFGIWQFHWVSLMMLSAGAVLACCHRPKRSFG